MAGKQDVAQSVELVFSPTAKDIGEALRARRRLNRRRHLLLIGALFALIYAAVVVLYLALDTPYPYGSAAIPTLAGALAGGPAFLIARRVQVRMVSRFARAQGECRAMVSDDGVRVVVANGDSRLGWELYPRYVETANLFVALSRDKSAMGVAMLPKRGADGPGDVDRLREILDRNAVRAGR
ncbi:YcxB family protein [Streptomyces xinghaiensis]|uniref:YcxB family protein n=1 Tax=Streptomyces xinghaiensis TaxID=1038928 RepID=UPI0002D4AD2D|nr:YcxB family protein [Streptomyces xinghaiensis]MZE77516.1 hypothetical protein [Streptomyces sp. SID5475]